MSVEASAGVVVWGVLWRWLVVRVGGRDGPDWGGRLRVHCRPEKTVKKPGAAADYSRGAAPAHFGFQIKNYK